MPSSNCQPVPTRTFFEIPAFRMPAALFATGEARCYSLSRGQASLSLLQRRERGGLEDPGFLVLVRAHLGAAPEVVLERGIVHQRVTPSLAVGLAFVAPHVHHLV